MKRYLGVIISFTLIIMFASCAPIPPDRYNTQKGAAIGAGAGALIGQAIGRNTESTLIGMAAGTILGALVGNARDQSYSAGREAAQTGKRVVYYDDHGGAVETIPGPMNQHTNCRKVTKRQWKDGKLISETVEEVCEGKKKTGEY